MYRNICVGTKVLVLLATRIHKTFSRFFWKETPSVFWQTETNVSERHTVPILGVG
jgi:hypothetical protein